VWFRPISGNAPKWFKVGKQAEKFLVPSVANGGGVGKGRVGGGKLVNETSELEGKGDASASHLNIRKKKRTRGENKIGIYADASMLLAETKRKNQARGGGV